MAPAAPGGGAFRGASAPGLDSEKPDEVEWLFQHPPAALPFPAPRPPAVHAGADVAAAHALTALQRPGLFRVLTARVADLHPIGHLEAAILHLLLHQRGVLQPRRQRRLLSHAATLAHRL